MATLFKNVQVVNNGKTITVDVLVKGKRIELIAPEIGRLKYRVDEIDCSGLFLLPGLIASQVHFREPGLEQKGTIYTETHAAAAGGITSFNDQPNTAPQTTTIKLLNQKLALAKKSSLINYGFNLGATNTNLEELKVAVDKHWKKFAGIKTFMGSSTGDMLVDQREILEGIFALDKLIIVHCEDEATIKANFAKYVAQYGDDIPMEFHPLIRSEEACMLSSTLAVELARQYHTRLHMYHVSTAKELVHFRNDLELKDKRITSAVSVRDLWFTADDYARLGGKMKWNPATKAAHNKTGLMEGFLDNSIDIAEDDHSPHEESSKDAPYTKCPSGAPMVQHTFHAFFKLLGVEQLPLLVEKACHNPALLLGIEDRGYITEGFFADMTLVNAHAPWTVSKENILYKCGWSPFEGETFNSRIMATFVNGKKVYEDTTQSNGKGTFLDSLGMALEFNR
jgi:dihydroorotase